MKVIRIFNAQPLKYPTFRACRSVNKYGVGSDEFDLCLGGVGKIEPEV